MCWVLLKRIDVMVDYHHYSFLGNGKKFLQFPFKKKRHHPKPSTATHLEFKLIVGL